MTEIIKPQPRQEEFLSNPADVVIYGGAAGGGKSWSLLYEPLRHVGNPRFNAVVFRKNSTQITNAGGLWDASQELYRKYPNAVPRQTPALLWRFPSGATVFFRHLERDDAVYTWQGSEICLLEFDELTHFCLTPDTEVLTENGWKLITEVAVGEKVPSLARNGEIQIKRVLATPSFLFDGELVTIKQRNGISARMTPNHSVPVMSQSKDPDTVYRFVSAEKMGQRVQSVIRSGDWKSGKEISTKTFNAPKGRGIGRNANATDSIPMDDWLELLGWYLSEGSAYLASKSRGGTSPCISIRQTKPCESLDNLIKRLPWRARSDGDGGYKIYSRQLYEELHPMGNLYEKRIPRFVYGLSKRQQKILFDAFVRGDGYVTKTGRIQIGLANESLIDDIHELGVYLGYSATKSEATTKTGFKAYSLHMSDKRRFTQVRTKDVANENYHGTVHCLTVEDNHTFLVRHNNRTHWTGNSEKQFFYMLSRNRSTCGVRPYCRCSTNPDSDSWVARFIQWWWDPATGYAIPERSGKIRYMARINEEIVWGNTPEEVLEIANNADYSVEITKDDIKSVSFVASNIYDNQVLLKADPGYMANLKALSEVERERLLMGNWLIKPAAGLYFPRSALPELLADIPNDVVRWVRAWDLAATDTDEGGDPAYTASVLLGKRKNGRYVIADATNNRLKAEKVRTLVKQCAVADKAKYKRVRIRMSIDPGQAGKEQSQSYIKMLAGFSISTVKESGTKEARAEPFAAQWQAGNVDVVAGPWTEALLGQYESFPESKFKDMVDAGSNAFNELELTNTASAPPKEDGANMKSSYWNI